MKRSMEVKASSYKEPCRPKLTPSVGCSDVPGMHIYSQTSLPASYNHGSRYQG